MAQYQVRDVRTGRVIFTSPGTGTDATEKALALDHFGIASQNGQLDLLEVVAVGTAANTTRATTTGAVTISAGSRTAAMTTSTQNYRDAARLMVEMLRNKSHGTLTWTA